MSDPVMQQRTEVLLHPSKAIFAVATALLIAYSFYLWANGFLIAQNWILAILPPFASLVIYALWTGDRTFLKKPLSLRKTLKNYFVEHGWWVLMWIVLIFGFGYFWAR